ncbi:hypothetical protein ACFL6S_02090 [Candidatus Poribacteria bacterium]
MLFRWNYAISVVGHQKYVAESMVLGGNGYIARQWHVSRTDLSAGETAVVSCSTMASTYAREEQHSGWLRAVALSLSREGKPKSSARPHCPPKVDD